MFIVIFFIILINGGVGKLLEMDLFSDGRGGGDGRRLFMLKEFCFVIGVFIIENYYIC